MNKYKFNCSDRLYETYTITDESTNVIINKNIEPVKNKLFNNDLFYYNNSNNTVCLIDSEVRNAKKIPGILILNNKKTYGKKGISFYYKCIPNNKYLPEILIPYKVKYSFSKNIQNKYILFKIEKWEEKHPIGTIVEVLGNVNILDCFYEYQLYCKNIHHSIKTFKKISAKKIKSSPNIINSIYKKYALSDRTNDVIYTIDPYDCTDFDDAISLKENKNTYIISIHIANVSIILDTLDIWDNFSDRISTIYLPNKKIPMLPRILSDNICSLIQNKKRIAFTINITINKETNTIIDYYFENTIIKVRHNFVYDSNELICFEEYTKLFKKIKALQKTYPFTKEMNNSHDLIEYLMILMNHYSAKKMTYYKNGIYRTNKLIKKEVNNDITNNITNTSTQQLIPKEIDHFIHIWKNKGCHYSNYNNDLTQLKHSLLNLNGYIHITSPIRRIVDLLNMIMLQKNLNLFSSAKSILFYNKYINTLESINKNMKSIKKVQIDCSLLYMCQNNNDITNTPHKGYVININKSIKNDEIFIYDIYLPTLKLVKTYKSQKVLYLFQSYSFKIYIFTDEDKLKQKIKIYSL